MGRVGRYELSYHSSPGGDLPPSAHNQGQPCVCGNPTGLDSSSPYRVSGPSNTPCPLTQVNGWQARGIVSALAAGLLLELEIVQLLLQCLDLGPLLLQGMDLAHLPAQVGRLVLEPGLLGGSGTSESLVSSNLPQLAPKLDGTDESLRVLGQHILGILADHACLAHVGNLVSLGEGRS